MNVLASVFFHHSVLNQKGIKYVLESFKLEWEMCTKYVWGKLWKQTPGKSKETG